MRSNFSETKNLQVQCLQEFASFKAAFKALQAVTSGKDLFEVELAGLEAALVKLKELDQSSSQTLSNINSMKGIEGDLYGQFVKL